MKIEKLTTKNDVRSLTGELHKTYLKDDGAQACEACETFEKTYRNCGPEVFCKKGVLRNFTGHLFLQKTFGGCF